MQMSSRKACVILAALIAALILCNVARAGVVAVERESLVEAAIQNYQTALADARIIASFDAFSDSVTPNDDDNNTGNAFAEQTSRLTSEMVLRELGFGDELLHFTSGEEAADLDASVDLPPARYDQTLTYESGGFAGAQADSGGSVATVPLPPAVSSAVATALLALLATLRVGERRRSA
jgi:hypothetical protein